MILLVHCGSYKTTEDHALSLDMRSGTDTAADVLDDRVTAFLEH